MLKKKERHALYVNVSLGATPKGAPSDMPLLGVIEDLKEAAGTPDACHFREVHKKWTRLMEVELVLGDDGQPKFACLLFTVGDRDGALDALQHMNTGDVRVPERDNLEGNARSAQLLIDLTEEQGPYRALLESVDMVGKTNLNESINAMLKACSSWDYESEGVIRVCHPTLTIRPVEDRELKATVGAKKELKYFVLVKDNVDEEYDETNKTTVTQRTVRVTIDEEELAGQALWDVAKEVFIKAKEDGYTKFRIVYQRESDDSPKMITYDTHAEDAEDFLIKRIKKITLDAEHDTARKNISSEIRDKTAVLLQSWIDNG